ncbi:MAG: hypothetical protein KF856_17805 [Cyclobacteriaceae bacterium]|nr:hypothetical protein [Cyclobacteriaceae bacterium]
MQKYNQHEVLPSNSNYFQLLSVSLCVDYITGATLPFKKSMPLQKHPKNLIAYLAALSLGWFLISFACFATIPDSPQPSTSNFYQTDSGTEQLTIAPAPVQPRQASKHNETEPITEEETESEDKNEKHTDAVSAQVFIPAVIKPTCSRLHVSPLLSKVANGTQFYILYHSWKIFQR